MYKFFSTTLICIIFLVILPSYKPESAAAMSASTFKNGEVGSWLWNVDTIEKQSPKILGFLQKQKVGSLYLYIKQDIPMSSYQKFIAQCNTHGIKVYALDGSPDWVGDNGESIQRSFFQWVKNYQIQAKKGQQFSGIHLDVEPYVHPEWNTKQDHLIEQYQLVILRAQSFASQMNLPLALDIPFWLDQISFDNQLGKGNLGEWVIQQGDILTVMAYRNQASEIENLVKEEFAWGEKYQKQIVVAVETDISQEGDGISFYGKTLDEMDKQLSHVDQMYNLSSAYGGIAIHHVQSWMEMKR